MIVTADQDWLSRTPGRSPPYVITATTRRLPGDDDHNLAGLVFRRIGQCISPDSCPNAPPMREECVFMAHGDVHLRGLMRNVIKLTAPPSNSSIDYPSVKFGESPIRVLAKRLACS